MYIKLAPKYPDNIKSGEMQVSGFTQTFFKNHLNISALMIWITVVFRGCTLNASFTKVAFKRHSVLHLSPASAR